jgi:hypothetical protein
MRHDPSGHNREYIPGYARIVMELPTPGGDGVDVVEVEPDPSGRQDQEAVDFLADYLLTRIRGGLEARSGSVLPSLVVATEEAQRIVLVLVSRETVQAKDAMEN